MSDLQALLAWYRRLLESGGTDPSSPQAKEITETVMLRVLICLLDQLQCLQGVLPCERKLLAAEYQGPTV